MQTPVPPFPPFPGYSPLYINQNNSQLTHLKELGLEQTKSDPVQYQKQSLAHNKFLKTPHPTILRCTFNLELLLVAESGEGCQITLRGLLVSELGATDRFFIIFIKLAFWNWVIVTDILWELQSPIRGHCKLGGGSGSRQASPLKTLTCLVTFNWFIYWWTRRF